MNPSIFEVEWNNTNHVMWVVDNYKPDAGIIYPTQKRMSDDELNKRKTDFLNHMENMFKSGMRLYASYFRPGDVWEHEVFVCPRCAHATSMEVMEDSGNEYHCKYCYTDWKHTEEGWDDQRSPDDDSM